MEGPRFQNPLPCIYDSVPHSSIKLWYGEIIPNQGGRESDTRSQPPTYRFCHVMVIDEEINANSKPAGSTATNT